MRVPFLGLPQPRNGLQAACAAIREQPVPRCGTLGPIQRVRRCLAKVCCGNRQFFVASGGTSPLQPICSQQACRLLYAYSFPLEGAGGNQKAEYIKAHLQSPVKWIRPMPGTSRSSCGTQRPVPWGWEPPA